MRLATFRVDQQEKFGLVLLHPATGTDWVFDPPLVEQRLGIYAARGTSPLAAARPVFLGAAWPTTLTAALAGGDPVMSALRRLEDFLRRFLEQADQYILIGAGWPITDVKLCAPIPRPRLLFGLVQNSPTVWRHRPERTHVNLFPQGHQRPQGAVIGPGDPLILPAADIISGGWNPELGVIIGAGGRDVPVEQARAHIAGLTIVSDVTFDYFRRDMLAQPAPYDWFEDAMTSWGDKKSDARTPIGPYLVTLDEIGDPYNLLIYTRQSGYLRDRSHTGAMNLSIERTVSWLSTFRELRPGDVIHMGTMGYDGSPVSAPFAPGEFIESEIEHIGVLRNPLVVAADANGDEPHLYPVPNVRDLMDRGQAEIRSPGAWTVADARHFWICFGNDRAEGLAARPYPRFLNAPNTALAAAGAVVRLPARARTLRLGCELACVIARVTSRVTEAEAEAAILGYTVLAALHDSSFADVVIPPATPQEQHLPAVYARWADGFNLVGGSLWRGSTAELKARDCLAGLDGFGEARGTTSSYSFDAPRVIAYISRFITLFPGDVVTLGRVGDLVTIPADTPVPPAAEGYAAIEGLGRVTFRIDDQRVSVTQG